MQLVSKTFVSKTLAVISASLSLGFAASALFGGSASATPGVASHDASQLPAGEYVLDPSHASLVAKISHLGFSNYSLRFDKLEARFTYDPLDPTKAKLNVTVDPTGIDTGSDKFNQELANGKSWFNAKIFPKISFAATKIEAGPDGKGHVTGDLTFLGVTKPVILDVTWNGFGSGLHPEVRTGFSATAHIKRSDFGNSTYVPLVGDDVDLLIEAEFTKK